MSFSFLISLDLSYVMCAIHKIDFEQWVLNVYCKLKTHRTRHNLLYTYIMYTNNEERISSALYVCMANGETIIIKIKKIIAIFFFVATVNRALNNNWAKERQAQWTGTFSTLLLLLLWSSWSFYNYYDRNIHQNGGVKATEKKKTS